MQRSGVILEMSVIEEFDSRYGSGETAASFTLDGKKLIVEEVIDYWQGPKYQYVRLLAEDERIYLLRRAEGNEWEIERVYSY